MDAFLRDLRHAWRLLWRKPTFTAVAVVSLALGIGANTTIFSLANELFLKPLPVMEPDRVVAVFTTDERQPMQAALSHLNWRDIREQNDCFSDTAAYAWAPMSVDVGDLAGSGTAGLGSVGGSEATYVFGQMVSGNYFPTLGIAPARGTLFDLDAEPEPGADPVAVLSHRFWTRRLGADPDVVGGTLQINGHPFTVVGVTEEAFAGTDTGVLPELWVPMSMNRQINPDAETNWFDQRRGLFLSTLARLKPGVDLATAQAQLSAIGQRLAAEYPDSNQGRSFTGELLTDAAINPNLRGGVASATLLLSAVVALVLLIACANVANLMLARASERRREIAVRLSIGAGRRQLVRQLLTESVLVALCGGVLGLAVAAAARRALLTVLPSLPIPITINLGLEFDGAVLAFNLLLAVATGLVFGLVPALQATKPQLVTALKEQGDVEVGLGRLFGFRNLLVVAQVALCLVALLGAGLFLRSLSAAQDLDPGFESEKLLSVSFDAALHGMEPDRIEEFQRGLLERVDALPGVRRATLSRSAPLQFSMMRSVLLEGQSEQDRTMVQVNVVSPSYFDTMAITVEQGRPFSDADHGDAVPVVIVNRQMAETYWPGQNPIGQRFRFFGKEPVEVVGVTETVKYAGLGEDPQSIAYQPLAQEPTGAVALIAATDTAPEQILLQVRREVAELAPGMPLIASGTIGDILSNNLWAPRLGAALLTIFGALALILAAIGLYGVLSFAVARRRREIGIRMALGAKRTEVLGLVLRHAMTMVAVGVALGLVAAFLLRGPLAGMLFVSPTDPLAILLTLGTLLLVAICASLVPAHRATGVDPVVVLRYE